MVTNNTKNLLQNLIKNGQDDTTKDSFRKAMMEKVNIKVQQMRQEIGKSFFKK